MRLFVGNIDYDATEGELRELFAPYEPILDLHRPLDRETGRPRGFAFVTLVNREVGEKAMEELNEKKLGGRSLRVNEAEDRRGGGPPPRRSAPDPDSSSSWKSSRGDDRPVDKDGNKVRYKGI